MPLILTVRPVGVAAVRRVATEVTTKIVQSIVEPTSQVKHLLDSPAEAPAGSVLEKESLERLIQKKGKVVMLKKTMSPMKSGSRT